MQCVFVLHIHSSCTFFTSHGFNISLGDVVISLCWPLLLDGAVVATTTKKVLTFVS